MMFDFPLNNPAGMMALVEAVELYEAAGDEYKAVNGDQHSRSRRAPAFYRYTTRSSRAYCQGL